LRPPKGVIRHPLSPFVTRGLAPRSPQTLGQVHHHEMLDGLGALLVAIGLTWVLLTGDKLGLVIAFAGVTLLAYGVLRPHRARPGNGPSPPIF
jgi:hypothetical protein